jgi:hypothetical protein
MKAEGGSKLCPICKTKFERPYGVSTKCWEAQVCCGKDCAAISRRKEDTPRRVSRRKELTPGARRYQGWGSNLKELPKNAWR